jgi:hypothetical protein
MCGQNTGELLALLGTCKTCKWNLYWLDCMHSATPWDPFLNTHTAWALSLGLVEHLRYLDRCRAISDRSSKEHGRVIDPLVQVGHRARRGPRTIDAADTVPKKTNRVRRDKIMWHFHNPNNCWPWALAQSKTSRFRVGDRTGRSMVCFVVHWHYDIIDGSSFC